MPFSVLMNRFGISLLLPVFVVFGVTCGFAAEGVSVLAVTPERTDFELVTVQPASALAYHEAEIGTRVSGVVEEVLVDIGDVVKEGDALAKIAVPELV
jgi:multidrug efflux pump subunit AcrA (membrane-fusion protein)